MNTEQDVSHFGSKQTFWAIAMVCSAKCVPVKRSRYPGLKGDAELQEFILFFKQCHLTLAAHGHSCFSIILPFKKGEMGAEGQSIHRF